MRSHGRGDVHIRDLQGAHRLDTLKSAVKVKTGFRAENEPYQLKQRRI